MFGWLTAKLPIAADKARRQILAGRAPCGMHVAGNLNFVNCQELEKLPARLTAGLLDVSHCARLKRLPDGLHCETLRAVGTPLGWLPIDLKVDRLLDLGFCRQLRSLPLHLEVDSLSLRGCVAFASLPEGLRVKSLDLRGCTRLVELPAAMAAGLERLDASGCTGLESLPENMFRLRELNLAGCTKLVELPHGLQVRDWIDLAGTPIRGVPLSAARAMLRWRGVPVPNRVIFDPESLTVREILDEPNVMIRQVMLERIGLERFVEQAGADVLDEDCDAGGPRRLLRVRLVGDDDLVCVVVRCPSTGQHYALRVPPTTATCRQAVAWTAGFADPDDYRPLVET